MAELGDHLKNFRAKPNNARTNDPQRLAQEGPITLVLLALQHFNCDKWQYQ